MIILIDSEFDETVQFNAPLSVVSKDLGAVEVNLLLSLLWNKLAYILINISTVSTSASTLLTTSTMYPNLGFLFQTDIDTPRNSGFRGHYWRFRRVILRIVFRLDVSICEHYIDRHSSVMDVAAGERASVLLLQAWRVKEEGPLRFRLWRSLSASCRRWHVTSACSFRRVGWPQPAPLSPWCAYRLDKLSRRFIFKRFCLCVCVYCFCRPVQKRTWETGPPFYSKQIITTKCNDLVKIRW